ncbi:MAG: hypothetical protein KatS3mg068_1054 [Candidatus Sericytochromatia bacterium]|nr:MAG: hypothetical protein KatS3mg068_1054 [Candidatus Sericytochromatia bacterium]
MISITSSIPFDTKKKGVSIVTNKSVYPRGNIRVGEVLLYTIELENNGDEVALDLALIDKLPDDVFFTN